MKDWVRPFLIEELRASVNEILADASEPEKQEFLEKNLQELERDFKGKDGVYHRLTDFLEFNFGDPMNAQVHQFKTVFGSVLADLPEDVFTSLYQFPDLYFSFSPHDVAEVKNFAVGRPVHVPEDEPYHFTVVVFPQNSVAMPMKALRGEIAHELAHVILGHEVLGGSAEDEADHLATNWGFQGEIEALRAYWIQREKGQKV